MLPVHLHADDETAARIHGEPNGKTEAWHILWAAPGATILAGLKGEFSRSQLFDAFVAQDYDAVMGRYPIQAGDTIIPQAKSRYSHPKWVVRGAPRRGAPLTTYSSYN